MTIDLFNLVFTLVLGTLFLGVLCTFLKTEGTSSALLERWPYDIRHLQITLILFYFGLALLNLPTSPCLSLFIAITFCKGQIDIRNQETARHQFHETHIVSVQGDVHSLEGRIDELNLRLQEAELTQAEHSAHLGVIQQESPGKSHRSRSLSHSQSFETRLKHLEKVVEDILARRREKHKRLDIECPLPRSSDSSDSDLPQIKLKKDKAAVTKSEKKKPISDTQFELEAPKPQKEKLGPDLEEISEKKSNTGVEEAKLNTKKPINYSAIDPDHDF
ncbi:hypothetical protein QBC43DRAFT_339267 [Cladorrhinum sp. PSN259]|nr:hypothetical protein QBC43DRAFT_339267 [Cladorrhinum sp. PSN259]